MLTCSMIREKMPLFFFFMACMLIVAGVHGAPLTAEEQPTVEYFTNTETAFSGQALVYTDSTAAGKNSASALPLLDSTFSSTTEDDGSINISIYLHNTGKVLSAHVDNDGDIVEMKSLTLMGELTTFNDEDRDQLKRLARTLNPTFDDFTLVRERFATFANFIIGRFPSDVPLDIRFIKGALQPSKTCWQLTATTTILLGSDFVGRIRNHNLDSWLRARKWVYDSTSDSICGLSYSTICDSIGSVYTNKAGFVTTLPLDDPGNIKEKPHLTTYHGNHSPVGIPVKYDVDVNNDFCLGRCGPGCFGNYVDYFNSSSFTVTAECFAHDVCVGEVGNDALIPTGGIGNACIDEFINASWGYVNGSPCNSTAKTDVLGWWAIAGEFFLLSSGSSTLQQLQGQNSLVPMGVYFLNSNKSKGRYLTAIKFKATGSSLVNWFYSGKMDTPTKISSGFLTSDNSSIISLRSDKSNLNGNVYDAQTGKPLSAAVIQITGNNLDTATQTSKTDSKGAFLFLNVSPYDTYSVSLTKKGYKNLNTTANVSMYNTPLSYQMDESGAPTRPEDISFELFTSDTPTTWSFTQYGSTATEVWTAERIYYSNIDTGQHPPYGKLVWSGNAFTYNFTGQSPFNGDTPIITDFTFDGSLWQSYNISIQGTVDNAYNLTSASIKMDVQRIYSTSYPQPPASWASQGNTYHVECTLSNVAGAGSGIYDWKITQANASSTISALKASKADVYPFDNGTASFIGADWAHATGTVVGELKFYTVGAATQVTVDSPVEAADLPADR